MTPTLSLLGRLTICALVVSDFCFVVAEVVVVIEPSKVGLLSLVEAGSDCESALVGSTVIIGALLVSDFFWLVVTVVVVVECVFIAMLGTGVEDASRGADPEDPEPEPSMSGAGVCGNSVVGAGVGHCTDVTPVDAKKLPKFAGVGDTTNFFPESSSSVTVPQYEANPGMNTFSTAAAPVS